MSGWNGGLLESRKAARVEEWLGESTLIADLSWGLVDTAVLHVHASCGDVIVKAAGEPNGHIARETTAHWAHTTALIEAGRTSRMLHADEALNLLVLKYQVGELVEGSDIEMSPKIHEQAGAILRMFHDGTPARLDDDYEARVTAKALGALDREHRIDPAAERAARRILERYEPRTIATVPTHGDWHPRNWLVDDGFVKAIDFGRFEFRPAATDLCRLAVKQWHCAPQLEAAFLTGYGTDPRDDRVWPVDLLREAVGTAVWAYQVGDTEFEEHGHARLEEAIRRFPRSRGAFDVTMTGDR